MIIVEDSKPQDHAAGQLQSLSGNLGPVHPQSSSSAPSYTLSYHTTPLLPPSPPPSYPKYPTYHNRPAPPPAPAPAVHSPQSPLKRFWKAFALAFLIYLAFVSLTHTVVWRMAHHHNIVRSFLGRDREPFLTSVLALGGWCS